MALEETGLRAVLQGIDRYQADAKRMEQANVQMARSLSDVPHAASKARESTRDVFNAERFVSNVNRMKGANQGLISTLTLGVAAIGRIGPVANNLLNTLGKLGLASIGIHALQSAFNTLTKTMLGGNAAFEQYEVSFGVLLKGTDDFAEGVKRAKERMAELSEFAAVTPFELPEIVQASKLLQTFGGTVIATGKTLTMVGDMAASAGAGFSEVAMWVGRAYSAIQSGRPFGEAAQRLQELGLMSGEVRNKMEDLQKTGASTEVQWKNFTESMGKFNGMMAQQAQTLTGLQSTLSDTMAQLMRTTFAPVMEPAKNIVRGLIDLLASPELLSAGEGIGKVIAKGVEIVGDVLAKIKGQVGETMSGIGAFGSMLMEQFQRLDLSSIVTAVQGLASGFTPLKELLPALMPLIAEMVAAFVDLANAVSPAVAAGVDAMTLGMKGFADVLAPVAKFLAEHAELVRLMIAAWLAFKVLRAVESVLAMAEALRYQMKLFQMFIADFVTGIRSADVALSTTLIGALAKAALVIGTVVGAMVLMGKSSRDAGVTLRDLGLDASTLGTKFSDAVTIIEDRAKVLGYSADQTAAAISTIMAGKAQSTITEVQNLFLEIENLYAEAEAKAASSTLGLIPEIDQHQVELAQEALDTLISQLFEIAKDAKFTEQQFNAFIETIRKGNGDFAQLGSLLGGTRALWDAYQKEIGVATKALVEQGKATEETAKQHAEMAKGIEAGLKKIMPAVDETFDEWQKRIGEMAEAYRMLPQSLDFIAQELRARGVKNVDAYIEALKQEEPRAVWQLAHTLGTAPSAEVEKLLREDLPIIVENTVKAASEKGTAAAAPKVVADFRVLAQKGAAAMDLALREADLAPAVRIMLYNLTVEAYAYAEKSAQSVAAVWAFALDSAIRSGVVKLSGPDIVKAGEAVGIIPPVSDPPERLSAPEAGPPSAGGAGGGAGAKEKTPQDLAVDAANAAKSIAEGLEKSMDVFKKIAGFKGDVDWDAFTRLKDAIVQAVTIFANGINEASLKAMETAGMWADDASKVMGLIGTGVENFTKLRDYAPITRELLLSFRDDFVFAAESFAEAIPREGSKVDSAAGLWADTASKVVGLISSGVDNLAKLADYSKINRSTFALFVSDYIFAAEYFSYSIGQGTSAVTEAASDWADSATKVVGLISSGVEGFKSLVDYGGLNRSIFQKFAEDFIFAAEQLAYAIKPWTGSLTEEVVKWSDNAMKLIGVISNGVAAFKSLEGYSGVIPRALARFTRDFVESTNIFALKVAGQFTGAAGEDHLTETVMNWSERASTLVGYISSGVAAFKSLDKYTGVAGAALQGFAQDFVLAANQFAQAISGQTTGAMGEDHLTEAVLSWAERAGVLISLIKMGTDAFATLTDYVEVPVNVLHGFIDTLVEAADYFGEQVAGFDETMMTHAGTIAESGIAILAAIGAGFEAFSQATDISDRATEYVTELNGILAGLILKFGVGVAQFDADSAGVISTLAGATGDLVGAMMSLAGGTADMMRFGMNSQSTAKALAGLLKNMVVDFAQGVSAIKPEVAKVAKDMAETIGSLTGAFSSLQVEVSGINLGPFWSFMSQLLGGLESSLKQAQGIMKSMDTAEIANWLQEMIGFFKNVGEQFGIKFENIAVAPLFLPVASKKVDPNIDPNTGKQWASITEPGGPAPLPSDVVKYIGDVASGLAEVAYRTGIGQESVELLMAITNIAKEAVNTYLNLGKLAEVAVNATPFFDFIDALFMRMAALAATGVGNNVTFAPIVTAISALATVLGKVPDLIEGMASMDVGKITLAAQKAGIFVQELMKSLIQSIKGIDMQKGEVLGLVAVAMSGLLDSMGRVVTQAVSSSADPVLDFMRELVKGFKEVIDLAANLDLSKMAVLLNLAEHAMKVLALRAGISFNSGGENWGGSEGMGKMSSFQEGAWRIAYDRVVKVHRDEMIVPAVYAQMIRVPMPSMQQRGAMTLSVNLNQHFRGTADADTVRAAAREGINEAASNYDRTLRSRGLTAT